MNLDKGTVDRFDKVALDQVPDLDRGTIHRVAVDKDADLDKHTSAVA